MSNHKWYTLSGVASRAFAFIAIRCANSRSFLFDLFPYAVFGYGIIELFGLAKGGKLLKGFNDRQTGKFRIRSRKTDNAVSAGNNISNRT